MEGQSVPRVEIGLPEMFFGRFTTLFAYGIKTETPSGITVHELFAGYLKIDADYLERHVQTILYEGKPVDDVYEHRIYGPSTIALSAALPGIFGAAFRKGGAYSALRPIAEESTGSGDTAGPIEITVKLFNMVAAALGPELLQRGIRIETADFLKFLEHHSDIAQTEATNLRLDGEAVTLETLATRLASAGPHICLCVRIKSEIRNNEIRNKFE